jgi:hypothetical protein
MNYIVEAHGLWYEGNQGWLQLLQQHGPLLTLEISGINNPQELLFREDYFDAATRVRCGRLYIKTSDSWVPENVFPRPYQDFCINARYKAYESVLKVGATAVLGHSGGQSYWTVVLSERAVDAHYLTLKSKTYFGVLPEVNRSTIPEANRQDILLALDAVVEAAPIQAPQPVVDACRNAACHMITAKFPESNPTGEKDLGPMVRWLNDNKHKTKAGAADIINRLHSRAKANAAAQHGTRPVSRQDANLAVDAIAFLLQDFGWAEAT